MTFECDVDVSVCYLNMTDFKDLQWTSYESNNNNYEECVYDSSQLLAENVITFIKIWPFFKTNVSRDNEKYE